MTEGEGEGKVRARQIGRDGGAVGEGATPDYVLCLQASKQQVAGRLPAQERPPASTHARPHDRTRTHFASTRDRRQASDLQTRATQTHWHGHGHRTHCSARNCVKSPTFAGPHHFRIPALPCPAQSASATELNSLIVHWHRHRHRHTHTTKQVICWHNNFSIGYPS